jgi:hypothetical protein
MRKCPERHQSQIDPQRPVVSVCSWDNLSALHDGKELARSKEQILRRSPPQFRRGAFDET